jgi:hypothetical protein
MSCQGLAAKIKAAEQGLRAQQLQKAVEDQSRWAGVPPWQREMLERKEAKRIAQTQPALAVALASKEQAELEQQQQDADSPLARTKSGRR